LREVPPSDRLGHRIAALLTAPNEARSRLIAGIYLTPSANNPIGRMNQLLPDVIAAEPVERKFLKAVKGGELAGYDYAAQLADAQAKGVLSAAECELLTHVRAATFEFISVDDFDSSELAAGARKQEKPALRSVANG
jgi:acyl-CoA dehydrogenase